MRRLSHLPPADIFLTFLRRTLLTSKAPRSLYQLLKWLDVEDPDKYEFHVSDGFDGGGRMMGEDF